MVCVRPSASLCTFLSPSEIFRHLHVTYSFVPNSLAIAGDPLVLRHLLLCIESDADWLAEIGRESDQNTLGFVKMTIIRNSKFVLRIHLYLKGSQVDERWHSHRFEKVEE